MPSSSVVPSSAVVPATAAYSRFFQRLARRYAAELHLLPAGVPDRSRMAATLAQLRPQYELGAALRILRQLVLHRLVELDTEGQASLRDITGPMTVLAELALDAACQEAQASLLERHGRAQDAHGQPVALWVIGMGKLGARELNVSSDIDLIYVYEKDGETSGNAQGRGRISNHEYFGLLVRRIQTLIGDTTEHGFVFRMDLALRPHGNSGPPAVSLQALAEYFVAHGREWERFAWLKSRVVASTGTAHPHRDEADAPGPGYAFPGVQKLREVVLPFVFRRYLDYAVFDALRNLHRQIRDHANTRSAGRPERANDVKLSRGGIREIEFTVQLLQVVRGGHFPELRCRPTLEALRRLTHAGLMDEATATSLADAYLFLRRVEHRIQYLDDQQTHILPVRDDDLQWIAATLGFGDTAHFLRELDQHRERVAQEFDSLLGGNAPRRCTGGQCSRKHPMPTSLAQLLEQVPPDFAQHLRAWQDSPRFLGLRDEASARVLKILLLTGQHLAQGTATLEGACRFADWLETMLGRETYFALLLERPIVHDRLLHLLGAARWPLRYMQRHPAVIDELASGSIFSDRFDRATFQQELERRHTALQSTGEADEESLMNLLRRAHHGEVFRTLARDVNGSISVEQVADDLSALADAVLETTTAWCWQHLRKKHRDTPQFAIIGYGKLGGLELGYGSDLDIVFVFDDDDDDAPVVYGNLVRKLISWLTTKTAEGDLYEIDTALRPNGNSGLLVTGFAAYANYQQQRGSNTAWTWEHQAMTRARFVLGNPHLRSEFDTVRQAVIQSPRDHALLAQEICTMRQRMRQAHPVKAGEFDVKHSPGGMIDIEFATQYLVLAWSGQYPQLVRNAGNIALLQMAEQASLLPAGIGHDAANAYREMRRIQHNARLNEHEPIVPQADTAWQQAGLRLWQVLFG